MSNNRNTVSRDRLAELHGSSNESLHSSSRINQGAPFQPSSRRQAERHELMQMSSSQTLVNMNDTDMIDCLRDDIKQVQGDIEEVKLLRFESLNRVGSNPNEQKKIATLEKDISRRNRDIMERLKKLPPSDHKNAIKKKFLDTLKEYQVMETDFSEKIKQRIKRVNPDLTEDEVESMATDVGQSGEQAQIFTNQFTRRQRAADVLSETQTRHQEIKKLTDTIIELQQMFTDVQMMIEDQGEVLKQTEQHMETTTHNMEKGNEEVEKAIKYAVATRHKKWCCFVIAIILLIVIAILVWWFGFGHKGVGN